MQHAQDSSTNGQAVKGFSGRAHKKTEWETDYCRSPLVMAGGENAARQIGNLPTYCMY